MLTLDMRRNPLKGFESEQDPDLEHKVESVKDEAVEKALREYEKLEICDDIYNAEQQIIPLEITALNPQQIDILLQKIIQATSQEKTNNVITGYYISRLIQQSQNSGHNEFVLTTKDTTIDNLCNGLTSQEKLRINIQGNTGYMLGEESQNCTYTITGNTEDGLGSFSNSCTYTITGNTDEGLGQYSENCTYTITGNTGNNLGWKSKNCTYTITGNTDGWLGEASENCTYTLHGKIGENSGKNAVNCIFRTTVKETYQKLRYSVDKDKGNRVQLIDKDGNILLEVELC